MCIKCTTKKFRGVPDVYFHDAQKMLVRILSNIASDPQEKKYRVLNSQGKAFQALKVDGVAEILAYVGFVEDAETHFFSLLPVEACSLDKLHEMLDHLLNIYDVRNQERQEKQQKSSEELKKKRAEEERLRRERFLADRKETAEKPVVSSVSSLVPFSGAPKTTFKDIGVDTCASGG